MPVNHWQTVEPRRLRSRCGILTWNCSGLTYAALQEVLQWANPQRIHIVVLTETRWQGSRTWAQQGWTCISSSGQPYRSCGIVTCIRSTMCHSDNIGWTEVQAGRLLHIRLFLQERSLDVVCAYQHAYHATQITRAARKQWFQLLGSTLSSFPSRNQLILAGDFNTSMNADRLTVGTAGFHNPDGSYHLGTPHADSGELQALMQHHGIVALNTWQSPSAATFFSSLNHGSRIDFICTKSRQADSLARQSTPLRTWPPLPLTTQGHFPVIGSIPLRWTTAQGCTLSTVGYAAKELCRQARRLHTSVWRDFCIASNAFLEETTWPCNAHSSWPHQYLQGSFFSGCFCSIQP